MSGDGNIRIFYSDDYAASKHAFDTTRKSQWIAQSLSSVPIGAVELVSPEPLTEDFIATVHAPAYVEAVRSGRPRSRASCQGFEWDPGLWTAVCASNGGAVAAALAALDDGVSGSLSSGLHHARRDAGAGFCTFNGLVLGARAALAAGARRVMILDLDAHCGGGTHELTATDPRILHRDVSVSAFDSYRPDGQRQTLELIEAGSDYLAAVGRCFGRPCDGVDLVIYNAGMDPFSGCAIGGLPGITEEVLGERERMVFSWAGEHEVPIAFVLAGGYAGAHLTREQLVRLHRLTVAAAAGGYAKHH